MTHKVTLLLSGPLPEPRVRPASPEDLAQWYVSQLTWSLDQGQRELSLACFDTASLGFPIARAAAAVLKAVMDFLYDHLQAERLTIQCVGQEVFRAYSLHWNIWYAPTKPPHSHDDNL